MKRNIIACLSAFFTLISMYFMTSPLMAHETTDAPAQVVQPAGHDHEEPAGHDHEEPAAASDPAQCVKRLHEALIKAMKLGDKAPCSRRYAILEPVIRDIFDFPLTCRLVLGRYWKGLDRQKRQQFIEAFAKMSTATYADRFSGYSGEKFRTVGTVMIKKHRALVKTILVTSEGEEIPLDYSCVLSGNKWKIVTVTAKGVNDLAIKRSEYTSFLKDKSIDQLISFLKEQTQKCAEARSGDSGKE